MAKQVIVNEKGKLQWRDIAKSWMLVILFPAITAALELIDGDQAVDWIKILKSTGVATGLFLIQRLREPAKVITTYNSNEQAKDVAETIEQK